MLIISAVQNIHNCGWNEENYNDVIEINRERLGEEKYNRLKSIDTDKLKCGYILGKNNKHIWQYKH